MNTSTSSLSEMINSSIVVLTRPSIASFEQYERRGTMRDAFIYVGIAGVIVGIITFLVNLVLGTVGGAIGGLIASVLGSMVGFGIFAGVLYYVGKQQGGTGTPNEVFYTCALYAAPLIAIINGISAIPGIGCLLLPVTFLLGLYQIYLGYLASRSSMNLDQNKAIISVVAAWFAQFIVSLIIGGVFGAILVAIGVASAQ